MIYIPEQVKKIDKILFDYLWSSKPAKIKRSTIIAPITEGGMGMIDLYYPQLASKIRLKDCMPHLQPNGKLLC